MNDPSFNPNIDSVDIQKYIKQAERKKEYNKSYYQNKIKPKRETTKQELEILRERCEKLQISLYHSQNSQIDEENFKNIMNENLYLNQQIIQLSQDNENLRKLLEVARQRNYELMMKKSLDILPPLHGVSIV